MSKAGLRFFAVGARVASGDLFKFGDRGAHTSRTMMLDDLGAVLSTVPAAAGPDIYAAAIIDDNCTGKATTSTRRATHQRLSEFYGLDPNDVLFRALRHAWDADPDGRPLIAVSCALARDPRLRHTASFIIDLPSGADLQREAMKDAVRANVGPRLNEGTLDKIIRNASSTWVQAGHLQGRTFKRRRRVTASPGAVAYAAYLTYLAGFRGMETFSSAWFRVLDLKHDQAIDMLQEARKSGLIDFRFAGDVVSISFDQLEADPRRA